MTKIDFPYSVDDEPTEEWNVEQVLHWWLLRANSESEAEYDQIVEGLSKQLEDGKKELWEAHEQVTEIMNKNNNQNNDSDKINADVEMMNNIENLHSNKNVEIKRDPIAKPKQQQRGGGKVVAVAMPDSSSSSAAIANSSKIPTMSRTESQTTVKTSNTNNDAAVADDDDESNKANNPPPDTIHIDITTGPYGGNFYDLQPKSRKIGWVGRSQGRKFKNNGITLPKDLEVSTSHGKFELKSNNDLVVYTYTDVGSTNGTKIDGYECERDVAYELKTGMEILLGATTLKVTLLSLA